MVAIITGKSVGLERSSAWVLGSEGQLGTASLGRGGDNVFVNAATGNLVITRQDEFLIGLGPDVSIDRTYNSQAVAGVSDGDNGDQWRMGVYRRIDGTSGDATIRRVDWDGSDTVYEMIGTNLYRTRDGGGAHDKIAWTGTQWIWTDGDSRLTDVYDGTGKLLSSSDTDGNSLSYTYSGALITQVTGADGEHTDLVYSGTKLQQLTTYGTGPTPLLVRVRYAYDLQDRLSSVTVDLSPGDRSVDDNNTYVTSYTYDGDSNRIASISQQDGSRVSFTYVGVGADYRVGSFSQTVETGITRTTGFDYSVAGQTTVTDPAGRNTILSYDAARNLTQISYPPEEAGATPKTVQFSYDGDGNLVSAALGPGNVITYGYDGGGNVMSERDSAGNTVTRTYGSKNELLTETKYLVPDPDGAGAGQPGTPLVTRYAYDSENHLRYVVSAEGTVLQHNYNAAGQRTSSVEFTANTYTAAGSVDESLLNAWAAAIGDKSNTRRTETAYNFRGAVQSVTSWSRLLPSGAFDTGSERSQTSYVYDQAGNLLTRQVTGSPGSEVFLYDGLNRTIMATDFNAAVTRTTFFDALGRTVIAHANGLNEILTYNRAGELVAFSKSNAGANLVELEGWPADAGNVPGGNAAVPGWLNPPSYNDETRWAVTEGPGADQVVAIQAGQQDSGPEGGGSYTNAVTIDSSKSYEFVYYFKLDDIDVHSIYFGTNPGTTGAYVEDATTGADATNPYFFSRSFGQQGIFTADKWYKVVGYVLAEGSALVPQGSLGGVYDVETGEQVAASTGVYRWNAGRPDNQIYSRFFNFGNQGAQNYSTYFYKPEIREVGAPVATPPETATTQYRYDNLGRLRMTIDPLGQATYMIYDAVGRKVADVDADGSIVEYRYDGSDRLTTTIRYATRLSAADLVALADFDSGGDGSSAALATTGSSHLVNGSFDQSGDPTNIPSGRSNTWLPGWSKLNPECFEQVEAGQMGVTGTSGAYWLDLDSVAGTGAPVPVGSNLLVNGSFDTSGSYTALPHGRSNTSLPGWTKTNAENFEQVLSGQMGVTGTDGAYWLDLDSVAGSGYIPVGSNLLVNGSFDTSGSFTTTSTGRSNTTMPGWSKTNPETFEQVASGQLGVTGTDGAYWLDLESVPGSGYQLVGPNLLTNGSFETSGTYTTTATGRSNTTLPGWSKSNSEAFEQVTSGQMGVTATNGTFWFDLDSVAATGGPVATGPNLLVNGSFDISAASYTTPSPPPLGSPSWGRASSTLPGWVKVNAQGQFKQVNSGYGGVVATDGPFWLDLDGYSMIMGELPTNMDIRQTVSGLAAGQTMLLQFDHANRTMTDSGNFEVYWNNTLVAAINSIGTTMLAKSYQLTAIAGDNVLRFLGTGRANQVGASLDNVRLYATTTPGNGGNMDISQTVDGLTAGQLLQLQFDHANRTTAASGSFEVYWNNSLIATVTDTGTAMQTKTYTVAAAAGSNTLRFKGIGTVDAVGASLDNVSLIAMQPIPNGGNMDISQTVGGLTAGQVMQLQFDHANRTGGPSGNFEVYWNGALVATVTDTSATMQTKTYQVAAVGGNNVLRFKSLGTVDAAGASLDNVRLFATQPVVGGGNMDISQTVGGLAAGQIMQLQFDHANRTTGASGSFEVYWNGSLLDQINSTGTAMQTKIYQVAAVAGNNTLRFKGTGTVDANGASIDNVRLFATQTDVGGGNMDVSQTVSGLAAGQVMRLQFDHANRTSAASGGFEVWWNGACVCTIDECGTAMQRKSFDVTAVAGDNVLRFKGLGTVDAEGASIDNIRLYSTEMVGGTGAGSLGLKLSDVRPDASADDSWTWSVYDSAGRVVEDIDGTGAVTSYAYDGASRLVSERSYANRLSASAVAALKAAAVPTLTLPAADAVSDRIARSFYDNDGRLIGTLDPEGFLTRTVYDKSGRRIETIAYAGATSAALRASGTFSQLLASIATDSARDIHSYCVYDARGMLRAEIDGEGDLTRYAYTPLGDVSEIVTGQKLDPAALLATPPTFANLPEAPSGTLLQTISYTRNLYGQALTETTSLTASTGTVTTYVYDSMRRLVSTTTQSGGPDPRTETRRYDRRGRLTAELSGIGSALLAALGPNPDAELVDPIWANYGILHSYDAADRLTATSDANGARTLFYYDVDGRLVYQVGALGEVAEYRYDALGRRTDAIVHAVRIDDETLGEMVGGAAADVAGTIAGLASAALDQASHVEFNVDGTIRRSTDALGEATTYTYNAFGELVVRSDPLDTGTAVQTSFTYDRRGQVRMKAVDSAFGGKMIVTLYGYDAFGREVMLTDPAGRSTATAFDRAGRVTSTTDALSHTSFYTYDARGNLVAVKDALNHVTRHVYDHAGREIFTVDALGGVVETSYDGDGRVLATRAYANAVWPGDWGLEITAADVTAQLSPSASDRITRNAYDKDGRLRFTVDGVSGLTEYRYDDVGNTIRTIRYDWTVAQGSTYSVDDLQAEVDLHASEPMRTTRAVYDAAGRLTFAIDATGNVTAFAYDSAGRIIKQVAFVIAYEGGDEPLDESMRSWAEASANPGDRISRAVYDRKGRLVYSVDGEGFVTEYRYNKADGVRKEIRYADPYAIADGASPASVAAQIGALPDSAIVTEFVYDSAGRLTETLDGLGHRTVMILDQRGQILSETIAYGTSDAVTTTRSYDALGRLTSESRADGTAEEQTTVYGYDALGDLVSITRAAGTAAETLTLRKYDNLGRLKAELSGIGSAMIAALGPNPDDELADPIWAQYGTLYGYDTAGHLTATADPNGARTLFYYDTADRLVYQVDALGAVVEYRYNSLGDRTDTIRYAARLGFEALSEMTGGRAADAAAAVAALADPALDEHWVASFDAAGRVSRMSGQLGSYTAFEYNSFGEVKLRRTALAESAVPGVASEIATSFAYDRRGKLETEIVDAAIGGKAITTRHDYDGFGREIELTDPNNYPLATDYDKSGRVISTTDALDNTTVYTYDARGNLVAVRDALNHITRYVYDHADQLIFTVDALGGVVETSYDGDGHAIVTRAYAGSISTLGLDLQITAADVTAQLSPSSSDRITRNAYDKDGRLRFTVDGVSGLTEYRYDDVGNTIRTIRYDWTVAQGSTYSVDDLQAEVDAHAAEPMRTTRAVYDAAGRLTFAIDATGNVTAFAYDSAGRLIKQTALATVYEGGEDPLAEVMAEWAAANPSADDRISRAVYDRDGRLAYSVDAESYVTEYRRNRQGDVILQIRYAARVSVADGATPASLAASLPASVPQSAITTEYSYDSAGRLEKTRDSLLNLTVMTLDQRGQILSTTVASGTADAVTTTRSYDALGRLTSETRADGTAEEQTTVYGYDALGDLVSITRAAGTAAETLTLRKYDNLGRLKAELSGIGSAMIAALGPNPDDELADPIWAQYGTLYGYDTAGHLTATADPNGARALFYYDTADRLVYQVDALGAVVEYRYNSLGDRTDTIRYAARLGFEALSEMAGGAAAGAAAAVAALADAALDEHGVASFDAAGRISRASGQLGSYTAFEYNSFGEVKLRRTALADSATPGVATEIETSFVYDRRGSLKTEIVDSAPGGKAITIGHDYDAFGREIALTDPNSHATATGYDGAGRIVSTTDALNHTTFFTYDGRGNLVAVRDALNHVTRYVYDRADRLIFTVDALGDVVETSYDGGDRVSATRSYANAISLAGFGLQITAADVTGRLSSDDDDRIVRNAYDKDDRLRFTVDATRGLIEYRYDDVGNRIRTIRYGWSVSLASTYTMDDLQAEVDAHAADPMRVTRSVYDAVGRVTFAIDAAGMVTAFSYDAAGRLIKQLALATPYENGDDPLDDAMREWAAANPNADDRVSRAVYDRDGRLVYSADAEGFVTEYRRNRQGDVILQIRYADPVSVGDGATPASLAALLPSSIPASAITTEYSYDSAGRLEKTRDALLNWTVMTLDQRGQILSTTVADGTSDASTTTRSYDELGRLQSETRGAGAAEASTTVYGYNALGELETITYAAGTSDECVTRRTYDAAGRLESEIRAEGEAEEVTTLYGYNAFGELESTIAAAGTVDEQVTTRVHDALGRVESETVADGSAVEATTSYLYNPFGKVAKVTDPRLSSGYFYYDARDRLVLQVDPEGYVTKTVYGLGDQPLSVTRYATAVEGATVAAPPEIILDPDDDATTTFHYDKLDRLTDITDAEGHNEHYELDVQGNRIQIVNKLDGVTDNTYDLLGRLKTQIVHANVHDSNGTLIATSVRTDFDYDRRGNLKTRTEGVGLGADERLTGFSYDKLDRLIEIDRPDVVSVTVGIFMESITLEMKDRFTYDRRGNVIASQVAGAPRTYTYYDHLNRKTDEVDQSGMLSHWDYDANGNVTAHKIYGDAVGFPETRPSGPPGPVDSARFRETHYTYDKANRLETSFGTALTTGRWDGDSYDFATGAIVRHLEYDAAGNAIRDYVGDVETRSFYDKLGRRIGQLDAEHYLTVWELDGEGNVLVETRHANRANGAIAQNASIQALHAAAGSSADDRVTIFTYDRNGRRETETRLEVTASTTVAGVLATTLHVASQIRYEYNGFGQVTRKVEANGDETLFTYDGFGRLTKTEAPAFAGHLGASVRPTTDNLFDAYGNVVRTALNDPNGAAGDARVTSYVYNRMGWLASMSQQIDATLSTSHSYTYDAGGRIVWDQYSRRKSNGANASDSIVNTYDVSGRLLSRTVATRITTPPAVPKWGFGDITRFKYNVFGETIGRGINFGADGLPLYQEAFDYDDGGRLWRSTEGGNGKIIFYDAQGNATLTLTSAGANVGALGFDAAKNSILVTGGSGDTNIADAVTTIGVFDKRGLQTAMIEPDRQLSSGAATVTISSSRTFNAFGETTSETDARSNTTLLFYNTMGRLIRKESPLVSWTDQVGNQANVHPTENYFYDVSGRLVAITDANGHTTRRNLLAGTGHDGEEALVTVEYHADDRKVQTLYDVFKDARISRNEYWIDNSPNNDPAKTDVLMAYDKLGRLIQVQHLGRLLTETFTYDQLGQRTRHTMNALTETTDYDRQGRVVEQVAFGGDTTTYMYAWEGTISSGSPGNLGGWRKTTINAANVDATEKLDYFNRTVERSDFGDHAYTHAYDWAGRMTSIVGPGETLTYAYLNTGRLASISRGAGNSTAFGYDKSGNETSEITYRNSQLVQNATATWDALGRMSSWAEAGSTALPAASILYEYDRVGNIRRQKSTFQRLDGAGAPTGFLPSQDNWYLYDAMDRVTRDRGILVAVVNGELKSGDDARGIGTIQRQQPGVLTSLNRLGEIGYDYEYDEAGRRVSMAMSKVRYEGSFPQNAYFREHKEMYDYYADGSLWKVRRVDGAETGFANSTTITVPPATGTGTLLSEFTRDAFGRTTSQTDWLTATVRGFSRTGILYNDKGQITNETVTTLANENNADALYVNTIVNNYGTGADYRLGAVVSSTSTVTRNNSAHSTATTTNTYEWRDAPSITEARIVTVRQVGGTTDYDTDYNYGVSGDLTSVDIHDGRPRTVSFINDLAGQVVRRDETGGTSGGAPHEIWYRFGGKQMGQVSNNGTLDNDYEQSLVYRQIWLGDSEGRGAFRFGGNTPKTYADFSQSQSPINSYEQGGAGGSYIIRAGDSLQSIATALWGNADLWYKLAEANGLSASSVLAEGASLTIPPGVVSDAHNASTFRPYDAAKALGDLSPSAAKPPKKPGGCGMLGQFLLLVIAIAVTAVVAPWATGIIVGEAAAGSFAAIAGAVIGGAIGGAAGSIVSQAVGVVSGQQSKFDWKGVGLAALGGAISGGLTGLGEAAQAAQAAGATLNGIGKAAIFLNGSGFLAGAARGLVTNSLTQGIGVATGLQKKFDWVGVATAGVAGGVSSQVGEWLNAGSLMVDPSLRNLGANLATSLAGGVASAGVRSLVTGTSFGDNLIAALPEAVAVTVGNAIGGAINRRIARPEPAAAPRQQPAGGPETAGTGMELPDDFPAAPLPGETPQQLMERRIAFVRRRFAGQLGEAQERAPGATMETTGPSGRHYAIGGEGGGIFANMLLDAIASGDIANVLGAYARQIAPNLQSAAEYAATNLQGDGPSLMVLRDLVVESARPRTQQEYAAVTAFVADSNRDILRYIENQRPVVVTGVRPRERSWKDSHGLYFPISYRMAEGAFRSARRGWQGVEQRHWEYRRAQNVAHPEGRYSHFVEDVGATIIFRGVGLVLGAGDAALHPAQTADNLVWLPARAIDAALVAENTPARVHLRNLGNSIANADAIDWAQFTGNRLFDLATLLPAARVARAGELAPLEGLAAREAPLLRFEAASTTTAIDDLARLEAAAAGRATVAAPAGARVSSTALAGEGSGAAARGTAAADSVVVRTGSADGTALGRATTAAGPAPVRTVAPAAAPAAAPVVVNVGTGSSRLTLAAPRLVGFENIGRSISVRAAPAPSAGLFGVRAPTGPVVMPRTITMRSLTPVEEIRYARPSGFRVGVRDSVWADATRLGLVRDPLSRRIMDPSKPWDMGHRPGYEFRKHQVSAADRGISRQQFLDEYNNPNHYRPELPSSNRSHRDELMTDDYYGD